MDELRFVVDQADIAGSVVVVLICLVNAVDFGVVVDVRCCVVDVVPVACCMIDVYVVDAASPLGGVVRVLVCGNGVADIAGCVVVILLYPGDVLNIVERVLDVRGGVFDFVDDVVCLVGPLMYEDDVFSSVDSAIDALDIV